MNTLLDTPLFAPYKASILAAAKPVLAMTFIPDDALTLRQSKLGGQPYWPRDRAYPSHQKHPLNLLLQLNFSEIPALPGFPERGILQWFYAQGALWGQDFDDPRAQGGFRVVYHEDVLEDDSALLHDFSFLVPPPPTLWQRLKKLARPTVAPPFRMPCAIRFTAQMQYPSLDGDCTTYLKGDGAPDIHDGNFFENEHQAFSDAYFEHFSCDALSLIGGYPAFTQDDPRRDASLNAHDDIQLIQLSSAAQPEVMMWGDLGIAHLFIHPDDLARRDFSRVLYWWDCY
ncbi:MAG: DUF1963 domain-containing protein [Cardiobacteriaceae bacterium]|nr:DUF1963 domain-containing protein [Cardiobacteriaceae bacterium]